MRNISFTDLAFGHYTNWGRENFKIFERITDLIIEIRREPFKGIGKPEPLKHYTKGAWSRRIDDEHRLIYRFIDDEIQILKCRYHYD